MNVTRFLLRSLLALIALSAHCINAQPRLLPESLEGPLARELLTLEPRVWRDARQARASLAQIRSRLESAGDNERVRTTADALYAAVDEALYRAKADGKDRVEVMPED